MIRAFLAIQPSEAVLAELVRYQEELAAEGHDIRWAAPETIHLTIKFLGDVPESELEEAKAALTERFATIPPFDVESRSIGVLPSWRKPKVLWIDSVGDGLGEFFDHTESVLSPLGFPPEEREFDPHVTIGRIRNREQANALRTSLETAKDRSFGISQISRATLFSSELRPEGAVHTAIADIPVGT